MYRPREVVGHADVVAVPRMAPIARYQLGQQFRKAVSAQITSIGQAPSRREHEQRDFRHRIAQMPGAQAQRSQVRALGNRHSNRAAQYSVHAAMVSVPPTTPQGSGHVLPGATSANSRCSSVLTNGSGYTMVGVAPFSLRGNAASAINSGGRAVNSTSGASARCAPTRQRHSQVRKTSSSRHPITVLIRSVRSGSMRTTGALPRYAMLSRIAVAHAIDDDHRRQAPQSPR